MLAQAKGAIAPVAGGKGGGMHRRAEGGGGSGGRVSPAWGRRPAGEALPPRTPPGYFQTEEERGVLCGLLCGSPGPLRRGAAGLEAIGQGRDPGSVFLGPRMSGCQDGPPSISPARFWTTGRASRAVMPGVRAGS